MEEQNANTRDPKLVIHLQMEPYLVQWLKHEHGTDPVEFPKNSAEYDIFEIYLIRKPTFALPNEPGENTVPIAIPYFKSKDVRGKYYLPKSARNSLKRCIRTRFVIQLWSDLFRFGYIGTGKQDLIWAWMENHGIEATDTNWSTIAKIYDRKRRAYNMRILRRGLNRVKKIPPEPPKKDPV